MRNRCTDNVAGGAQRSLSIERVFPGCDQGCPDQNYQNRSAATQHIPIGAIQISSAKLMNEKPDIYQRIGGEEGIAGMVDSFYEKVLADPELAPYFTHVPIDKLRRMQREFFAAAVGGPIVYSGRPLSEAHHSLDISRREFQRFTEHLIETLEEKGLDKRDVSDVIAKVNLYADEITQSTGGSGED